MSELRKNDSDSDVGSNSSWTLLTEDANGNDDRSTEEKEKPTEENTAANSEQQDVIPEIKENELATKESDGKLHETETCRENDIESLSSSSSTSSIDSLPEIKKQKSDTEQGCLTLDEFMNERELAHDYDYDDRAEFWEHLWNKNKRGKRKCNKCKADNLTTMTVVGAVLSIAGISLICMMSPFFNKQMLTPDIHNRIEKNFTKIDTPYASANNLKVYVDKSEKAATLIGNVDVLDPIVKKCCKSNALTKECNKISPKNQKLGTKGDAIDKPITCDQFLKEQSNKKVNSAVNIKETAKSKSTKSEKCIKPSEDKKLNTKKNSKNLKTEANQKQVDLIQKKNKKQENDRSLDEKHRSTKTSDKGNRYIKNKLSKSTSERNENEDYDGVTDIRKEVLDENAKQPPKFGHNFRDMFESLHKVSEPNFVLVDRDIKVAKEINHVNSKKVVRKVLPTLMKEPPKVYNQNVILPAKVTGNKEAITINTKTAEDVLPHMSTKVKNANIKQVEEISATSVKNTAPVVSNQSTNSNRCHAKLIACQLIQDLCLLKLTGRLSSKEKSKQKKLKRKVDRKKLRAAKVIVEDSEREPDKTKPEATPENKNITDAAKQRTLTAHKSVFNFKPKLVDNRFVNELKLAKLTSVSLSNFDLLKELPFMRSNPAKKEGSDAVTFCRTRPRIHDRDFGQKIDHRTSSNLLRNKEVPRTNLLTGSQNDIHLLRQQRFIIHNEIANQKSTKFLKEAREKNEERIRILEQMRQDNRLKIQAIIRERTERLKRDASLGIYNVPLPNYSEVSEKLKQLRLNRTRSGFAIESVSSSDSEPDKNCIKSLESKISSELMTALKMGKKVSDTFREWTLKKAPTLTCLKNYCNSKVSQLSERLTSQCTNHTDIKSTLNKEELETLKCRKEKHEQLKKFWKAKQEYMDKRIEICELLKKKLSIENLQEEPDCNIKQGVKILDSIINDVLKSVRSSKSCVDKTCHAAENIKETSKSVGNIVAKDEKHEKPEVKTRKGTFSANSDDLYNWLFERRAMEIRRRDNGLWNAAKPGHAERKKEAVSKQDPSKGYHEKIIKKHN